MKLLTMPAPASRSLESIASRWMCVFDLAAVTPGAEPTRDAMTLRAVEAIADEAVEELRRLDRIAGQRGAA